MRPFHSAHRAVASLALLMLATVAPAQDERWYNVEMVIFANASEEARTAESWRDDGSVPDLSTAVPIGSRGVAPVSPSAYRLRGIWQALRASPGYQPLRHLAWTQRGTSARSAPDVLVGDSPADPVRGVVQVSRGRFLHVNVDLLLQDVDGSYRFKTKRRMRSNELHYLDHPMFGLVVVITPLEG